MSFWMRSPARTALTICPSTNGQGPWQLRFAPVKRIHRAEGDRILVLVGKSREQYRQNGCRWGEAVGFSRPAAVCFWVLYYAQIKPNYAKTTRQVTLRSLTAFSLIASRYGNVGTAVPNPAWGFAPNPTRDIVPGSFFASRGLKPLFSRKAYSPHSAIRPSMVPSASQPVTSSSIFAESSEPFFVATP